MVGHAVGAVALRQPVLGHVEGAEHEVQHREGRREILVAHRLIEAVVPAVEDRAGDDVFEGPEGPVHIGVHQAADDEVQGRHGGEGGGRKAEHPGKRRHAADVDQPVHRVHAIGRGPRDLPRRVVDGVERPQGPPVQQPVQPVLRQVGDRQDDQDLRPQRHGRRPAVAGGERPQRHRIASGRELQQQIGRRAVNQDAEHPVEGVVGHLAHEEPPLAGIARPQPRQQPEPHEAGRDGDDGPGHRRLSQRRA